VTQLVALKRNGGRQGAADQPATTALPTAAAPGTGRSAAAPGYLVGGKTGTAEKAEGRGYSRKRMVTSFAGVFPMHDPRYVVLVVLDEPKGIKETHNFATAGWNAAPTVGQIVPEIAPILGVEPVAVDAPGVRERLVLPAKAQLGVAKNETL